MRSHKVLVFTQPSKLPNWQLQRCRQFLGTHVLWSYGLMSSIHLRENWRRWTGAPAVAAVAGLPVLGYGSVIRTQRPEFTGAVVSKFRSSQGLFE